MIDVGGTVEKGFEGVREAFAEAQGKDPGGAQLCVYRHGKKVVDIWGGRDREGNRPYTDDTLAVLMSCTKGTVAMLANIFIERGLLDPDAPVARYWPEFAAGGKAQVPVRHLLSHSVGLSGFAPETKMGGHDILDWKKATDALASMEPLWEPGTAYFYHAVTIGYLVGEVLRRISGKSYGQLFRDEIAKPLDLELWVGLPESQEPRVARHFRDAPALTVEQWRALLAGLGIDAETRLVKTLLHTFETTEDLIFTTMNRREGHAVELPAGNGIGTAAALAKMYAAAIGEVDGVRLLRRETMERARTCLTDGIGAPEPLGKLAGGREPQHFGLGFELMREAEPMFGPGSFGHAGAGGRMGFAHPESGIALAYVCNNMPWDGMTADARWLPWTKALHEAVGK